MKPMCTVCAPMSMREACVSLVTRRLRASGVFTVQQTCAAPTRVRVFSCYQGSQPQFEQGRTGGLSLSGADPLVTKTRVSSVQWLVWELLLFQHVDECFWSVVLRDRGYYARLGSSQTVSCQRCQIVICNGWILRFRGKAGRWKCCNMIFLVENCWKIFMKRVISV